MRASFDKLISWTGILLAFFLLVAGGALTYTSSYIAGEVETQLGMQDITMPEGAALTRTRRPPTRPRWSPTPAARWTLGPRRRRMRTTTSGAPERGFRRQDV